MRVCRGETTEESAARELKEETGYVAERLVVVGRGHPSPAASPLVTSYVLALGAVREGEAEPEESEWLAVEEVDESDLQAWMLAPSSEEMDIGIATALWFAHLWKSKAKE
eukprot:PLAT13675.2.p2 GENE.PLAT13675.2~~PLAT13675.2.p2  ORF type:complete len:122 (+),score=24.52 PLAT13675.2:37-366(+)